MRTGGALVVVGVLVAAALSLVLWRRLMHALEAAARADWGRPWLNRVDGLNRIFCARFHRLRPTFLRLPASGAALVVANHVSGLDPLLMIAASRRPLRFIIAREQYDRWWLRWLFRAVGCIPVERRANPRAALAAARRALAHGEVVALFPHGRIHLDHEPPIRLKRGVLHLSEGGTVPIYPVRLEGIRGQGRTVSAVFMRSRVRLVRHAPLYRDAGDDADAFLERLARQLSGSGH